MSIEWLKILSIIMIILRAIAALPPEADHRASTNGLADAMEIITGSGGKK